MIKLELETLILKPSDLDLKIRRQDIAMGIVLAVQAVATIAFAVILVATW